MRTLLLAAVLTAGCGTKPPVADPDNAGGGDGARYRGPPVVELVETTSAVAGAEALAAPIHDAMVHGFDADGSYATEGGPASYHLEASLAALTVTPGNPGLVECSVKMTMMRAPDLALVGFVDGKASVAAAAGDEQLAAHDCVAAVVENLVSTKVIPAMRDRDAER